LSCVYILCLLLLLLLLCCKAMSGAGYYYIKTSLSSLRSSFSFLGWTPLGTARHTGSEHAGREPGANVNTGLEFLARTLTGALVFKPHPGANHRILSVAAEAPGLLEVGLHLHLLHPPVVGVALLGLERSSMVLVPLTSTASSVLVSLASIASVVLSVVPIPVRSSVVVDVVPGNVPSIPVTSTTSTPVVVVSPVGSSRSPVCPASTPRSSSLLSSIPGRTVWSRAGVTTVLGLPGVPSAGGVGLPCSILGTGGSDGRPYRAGELTQSPWKVEGAVARNTRAESCELLLYPGLVLDTAGHVSPAPIRLALGNIVPTSGTDHGAGVTNIGLGAVTREPRAGHQAGHCRTSCCLECYET